jgi:hypothetical protein
MARRSKPKSTPSRRTKPAPIYATRHHFEAVLAIIEKNTRRIERLEDVFALQTRERPQVKQELAAIKAHRRGRGRARPHR